jgi:DnaJ-class molecular chaperone
LIHLHFDEVISPQTRRVIKGKGMPIKGKEHFFGDLIVQFDIEFP